MTIGETRLKTKQAQSDEIERHIRAYLDKGGKIEQICTRETKHVDLTFRHYSKAAMEGVR